MPDSDLNLSTAYVFKLMRHIIEELDHQYNCLLSSMVNGVAALGKDNPAFVVLGVAEDDNEQYSKIIRPFLIHVDHDRSITIYHINPNTTKRFFSEMHRRVSDPTNIPELSDELSEYIDILISQLPGFVPLDIPKFHAIKRVAFYQEHRTPTSFTDSLSLVTFIKQVIANTLVYNPEV